MKRIAVFGAAGTMGFGIMQSLLGAGYEVLGFDDIFCEKSTDAIQKKLWNALFQEKIKRDKLRYRSKYEVSALCARAHLWSGRMPNSITLLRDCDAIIEAIVENEEAKRNLYAMIEPNISSLTPIFTNTSTIQIARLAQGMAYPERLMGLHFFNPVPRMPVVEAIPHGVTNQATIMFARELANALGKEFFLAPDFPGFIINRICVRMFPAFARERDAGVLVSDIDRAFLEGTWPLFSPALRIVEDGFIQPAEDLLAECRANNISYVTPKSIDALMCLGIAMPRGPFALAGLLKSGEAARIAEHGSKEELKELRFKAGPGGFVDLVGADVARDCIISLARQEPNRGWVVPKFLDEMVENKTLGEKSGKGFYSYGAAVDVEEFGDVARITFGDGGGNILSLALVQKLTEQFRIVRDKRYRAVFLAGRGSNFSVGANIKEFPLCLRSRQNAYYAIGAFADLMSAIAECKTPVIALVRGRCYGGGYELALACDFIFAEEGSEVRLPEVGLGILPGAGGTQRLLRRTGFSNGAPMVLDAQSRKAQKPFVDGVVASGEFSKHAPDKLFASVQFAKRLFPPLLYSWKDKSAFAFLSAKIALHRLLGFAPVSAQLAFDAMWRGNTLPLEEGLELERAAIAGDIDEEEGNSGAFQSWDAEEGIRAFLEKRKPRFTGK